jgi:hypothetical protein
VVKIGGTTNPGTAILNDSSQPGAVQEVIPSFPPGWRTRNDSVDVDNQTKVVTELGCGIKNMRTFDDQRIVGDNLYSEVH